MMQKAEDSNIPDEDGEETGYENGCKDTYKYCKG